MTAAADPGSGSPDSEGRGLQGRLVLRRLQVGDSGQFCRPLALHAVLMESWHRLPSLFPSSRLFGEL